MADISTVHAPEEKVDYSTTARCDAEARPIVALREDRQADFYRFDCNELVPLLSLPPTCA